MKLLFARLTILVAFLSFVSAIFYFSQKYSLGHALPLASLVTLATTIGTAIFLYILSFILMPITSIFKKTNKDESPKKKKPVKPFVATQKEKTIQHNPKEQYTQHSHIEETNIYETQQNLEKMMQEQGTAVEDLLILPSDLSFLLAKESIEKLFLGSIKEEDEEAGTIAGSSGFEFSPQEFRLSIQSITHHTSKINIISKSSKKRQSDIKNSIYIKKISDFLRDKEKFYTE